MVVYMVGCSVLWVINGGLWFIGVALMVLNVKCCFLPQLVEAEA